MNRLYMVLLVISLTLGPCAFSQEAPPAKPNTLLVLKNGAEVRGVFVELKDERYILQLSDGRTMDYRASEVESMRPIPAPEPAPVTTGQGATSPQQIPSAQETPRIDLTSCRIFITEKGMDISYYEAIEDIKVSKKWYGSASEMYGHLAEKALKEGADAVIGAHTWYAPAGFSWAAPHAGGLAVKLTEAGRKAIGGLEGRCY